MKDNSVSETYIEKMVRENTPDFVVGTSKLVQLFRTYEAAPKIFIPKKFSYPIKKHGEKLKQEFRPDFVLLNRQQQKDYFSFLEAAGVGKYFSEPFKGCKWFIECFGEYWHSEAITGYTKKEHEELVKNTYQKLGKRVLILWEEEISEHWEEIAKPKIDLFLKEFASEEDVDWEKKEEPVKLISDLSIQCLENPENYRVLSEDKKKEVVEDLVKCYSLQEPYENLYEIKKDREKFFQKIQESRDKNFFLSHSGTSGSSILNHFVKSRYDARVKKSKTIHEIWKDLELMRKCIDWQFMNETGRHSAKRFMNAMAFSTGFRLVSNIGQWVVTQRLRDFRVKNGIFFDPCAGWGGRMLAAMALGMKYIAIDANPVLVKELNEVKEFLGYEECEIYYGDSASRETVLSVMKGRKADLIFTCPPYFDEEEYCADSLQSIVQFPSEEEWLKGFLQSMLNNCAEILKEDGNFIISVNEKVNFASLEGFDLKIISSGSRKNEDDYFILKKTDGKKLSDSFVVCQICGSHLFALGNHLRRKHKMSHEDYLKKFPDGKTISPDASKKKSEVGKTRFGSKKRTYTKRYAFLLPDGTYTGREDCYLRTWGKTKVDPSHIFKTEDIRYLPKNKKILAGIEGKDYVVCDLCGYAGQNLTRHLKKEHGLSQKEYTDQTGKSGVSEMAKEAFHQAAVSKWKTQKTVK